MKQKLFLSVLFGYAAAVAAPRAFTLYNVTPLSVGREATAAADAVELQARTGADLALYSLTLHPEGVPAIEKAERYVESFRAFRRALDGTPVRAGVLVQAILGHWPRVDKDKEPWTMTVDSAGKNVRFCPIDPGFSNYIARVFTLLAREKPAFILTDDDVRGYSHNAECFCARHMALFNARRGTSYTADALRARELIKGKVLDNSMLSARGAAETIAEATKSEVVQVIGSKFVLYKRNEKEPKIVLVKAKKA